MLSKFGDFTIAWINIGLAEGLGQKRPEFAGTSLDFRASLAFARQSSRQGASFVEFHLLEGPEAEDHTLYASHTAWESRETDGIQTVYQACERAENHLS
jgi:hypothetical protein